PALWFAFPNSVLNARAGREMWISVRAMLIYGFRLSILLTGFICGFLQAIQPIPAIRLDAYLFTVIVLHHREPKHSYHRTDNTAFPKSSN
ncbi:hypothetical protein ACPSMW_005205, partial [Escherichia coli]